MIENPFLTPFNPQEISEQTTERMLRSTLGLGYRVNGKYVGGGPGVHIGDGFMVVGPVFGEKKFGDQIRKNHRVEIFLGNGDKGYSVDRTVIYEDYGLSLLKLKEYELDLPFVPYDPEPNLVQGETLWVTSASIDAEMSTFRGRYMGMFKEYFDDDYVTDSRQRPLFLTDDVFILQVGIDHPTTELKAPGEIEIESGVFNAMGKLVGVVSGIQEIFQHQPGGKATIPAGTKVAFVTTSKQISGMKLNSEPI